MPPADVFGWIHVVGIAGVVISVLLAIIGLLITLTWKKQDASIAEVKEEVKKIGEQITQHVLDSKDQSALMVSKTDCSNCGNLNNVLTQIVGLQEQRRDRWKEQARTNEVLWKETRDLWAELDAHRHDDKGRVVRGAAVRGGQ
jgi:hypothetical protein